MEGNTSSMNRTPPPPPPLASVMPVPHAEGVGVQLRNPAEVAQDPDDVRERVLPRSESGDDEGSHRRDRDLFRELTGDFRHEFLELDEALGTRQGVHDSACVADLRG